jgi:hypothetical protein
MLPKKLHLYKNSTKRFDVDRLDEDFNELAKAYNQLLDHLKSREEKVDEAFRYLASMLPNHKDVMINFINSILRGE